MSKNLFSKKYLNSKKTLLNCWHFFLQTWLPSLADTSAILSRLAWCNVKAALVAPPATPTMDYRIWKIKFICKKWLSMHGNKWKFTNPWDAWQTSNKQKVCFKNGRYQIKQNGNVIENVCIKTIKTTVIQLDVTKVQKIWFLLEKNIT